MDNGAAKIRWQCRRGMRELDLLLFGFFESCYDTLPDYEKESFASLLKCSDNDLLEWLMGRGLPDDAGLVHVIEKIRDSAAT